ncbi:MAG: MerR family DNA-binding transcriptional regulator [Pseudomonadota bacterium]
MKDAQRRTRRQRGTVSVQEAADLLGVTRRTIHRWEAQGRMPPRVLYGRRPQYRRLDICAMTRATAGRPPSPLDLPAATAPVSAGGDVGSSS